MRDSAVPQMLVLDRPFSLGRFQMAVWFTLILMSFLFIFVVTLDLNSISAESFVLLGISGTTALAAVAVDQNKDSPLARIQQSLTDMGLKTRHDIELLDNAKKKNKGNGAFPAKTVVPDATIPADPASGRAAIANPTVDQMLEEYRVQVSDIASIGFLKDLVNDVNGPTIHRWQILIWTLVLGAIYLALTYMRLETPTFGTNLLALMGIGGGMYVGFKIPEKQTT